jgi:hypothetical protein
VKLVVKARVLHPYAEPLITVVTLDEGRLAELDGYRQLFDEAAREAPTLTAMSFSCRAAIYYAEDELRERLTAEQLARLDEEDVTEVGEDFDAHLEEARTECEQVTLLSHGLFWEAGFRHTDDWVRTEIVLFGTHGAGPLAPEAAHRADR